jgi:hypothetical protein
MNSRRAVLRHFRRLPREIQNHFQYFPDIITSKLPLEVGLAYLFYAVEIAHRDTLYCGLVKLHHADSALARRIVRSHHITRAEFRELFQNVLGKSPPDPIRRKLQDAEKIRDKAIHGSEPTTIEMRRAIVDILDYAKAYNGFVRSLAGFPPFGDLRGFHGKKKRLEQSTTRWLMRGIGFRSI